MPNWISILGLILGLLFFVLLLPQTYLVIKTKDTRAMSFLMTLFYFITSVVLTLFAVFLAIANHNWVVYLTSIVLNSMYCSGIILWIKARNMHKAKKLNLTEEQYYQEYLAKKSKKKDQKL